jgi:hypothetical protein
MQQQTCSRSLGMEFVEDRIAAQLDLQNLREECDETPLRKRILRVRDNDEVSARPEHATRFREKAFQALDVVNHVHGEGERETLIRERELLLGVSRHECDVGFQSARFPEHGLRYIKTGTDEIRSHPRQSADVVTRATTDLENGGARR